MAREFFFVDCDTDVVSSVEAALEVLRELGATVEAIKLLAPKRVAPAHYNTWPPIEQDAKAWAARVKAETKAEPIVLEPGGTIEL